MSKETYDKGLKIRKEVLGAEFVENSFKTADDFNRPMQDLATEYCWGYVWGREGLDKRTRSLLNLAMIAGDALVRGGRLDVGAERRNGSLEMVIRAEGPRILLDPKLRETIAKGHSDGEVEPRAAGAWLAHTLAAEAGGSIQLSDPAEAALLIGVTLPGGTSAQG